MRASRSLVILCFGMLAGCNIAFQLERDGDGGVDAVDEVCVGSPVTLLPRICVPRPPGSLTLPLQLDTDDDAECSAVVVASGRSLCVLVGTDVAIVHSLAPEGSRPLVIAALGTLRLGPSAVLDVSGSPTVRAAGSEDVACAHLRDDGTSSSSAGGGAGGSYLTSGTRAGGCNAIAGGESDSPALLTSIRGGCRGGTGGSVGAGTSAAGGASGGAVYLLAGETIEILGVIDSSGDGGRGGTITGVGANGGGGGGGGSGGLIGLDAPSISIRASARLVANGGGGGGGASSTSVTPVDGNGRDGASADPIGGTYPFAAPGGGYGNGASYGGGGANGLDEINGPFPGGNGCSAGGGAGALGTIRAYATTLTNESLQITPALTMVSPP